MQHSNPRKTYYVKVRVFALIYVCVSSAWFLWNLVNQNFVLNSLSFLFLNGLIILLCQTRIVTSPSGISYHNSGLYSIHSTWENIEKVSFVKFRGFEQQRCVILKQGAKLGWWTELAWAVPKQERGRMIPILTSRSWSHYDNLINDIRKYAPEITGLD